jgi:hypothetical protein
MIGLAQQHSFTTMTIQTNPPHSRFSSKSIFPEKHSLSGHSATKRMGDKSILQNTACKTCINKQEEKVVPNHHNLCNITYLET